MKIFVFFIQVNRLVVHLYFPKIGQPPDNQPNITNINVH